MFNIFKKKSSVIEFWPINKKVARTPIIPASDFLPDWWKSVNINRNVEFCEGKPVSSGTVKKCPGVRDFMRYGWILRAWCDIHIKLSGKDKIECIFSDSDYNYGADPHSHPQFIDLLPDKTREEYFWVLKLVSPWRIKTPLGYSLMELGCFYFFNENFDIAPGIQDADIMHQFNPFLLIKKNNDFIIEKGTPISALYPFKRENITGKCMPVNKEKLEELEEQSLYVGKSKFSSLITYRQEQLHIKNQIKKSKCPFSF